MMAPARWPVGAWMGAPSSRAMASRRWLTSMAVSVSRTAAVSRAAEPKPSVHQSGQAWRCTSSLPPCSFSTQAEELLRGREAQVGPGVFLIPCLDEVAGGGGGRRVVGEVAGELDADAVERIVAVLERGEVVGHVRLDEPGVALFDAPEVGGHVVVAAIGEDAFAGGGFPPEAGRLVERQQRAGLVDAHVEVADADAVEVIRQAPAGAVDIVLHRGAHGDAELLGDRAHGADQGGEGVLGGQSRTC